MPHGALGLFRGDVFAGAGFLAGGAETAVEVGEQRLVAGHEPRVQQRRADRRVFAPSIRQSLDRSRRVPNLQAEIPQEIQHVFDDLQRLRRRIVRGQEQQIDVAERRQHAPAVAAGRGDAQLFRRR